MSVRFFDFSNHFNQVLDPYFIDRLRELYRLATNALDPNLLTRANWPLIAYFSLHKRDQEVINLCEFVIEGAFGHLGVYLISANILYYLAKSQERTGKGKEALRNYQKALDIAIQQCESVGSESLDFYASLKNIIMHDLASLYEKQGNYEKALELCREVIKTDTALDDKQGLIKSLNQLSLIQRKIGQVVEARATCERALKLAQQENDSKMAFVIRQNLSTLRAHLGELDAWNQSIPSLTEYASSSQDMEAKVLLLINDAGFRLKQEGVDAARDAYVELEALLPHIQDTWLQAGVMHDLATFHSECGHSEKSILFYQKALGIHRSN